MAPWKGRDALDAVVLMDMGIAQYREHFQPGMTAHRVITHGGDQPNVIPAKASCWWYFRHGTAEGARILFDQAQRIAKGAAMMANCEVSVEVQASVWPVRNNQRIAEVIQRNIDSIGMPAWSDGEQKFAKDIQKQAGVKETGLRTAATPLTGPSKQIAASNDSGDVTWVVPTGRIFFPSNIPGVVYHHWTAGAALATSIAHKGGVVGAKALATSALDFFIDPSLLGEVQRTFREEIGDVTYRPLLPPDQMPPLELNKATMERYRALMEKNYVPERPRFV